MCIYPRLIFIQFQNVPSVFWIIDYSRLSRFIHTISHNSIHDGNRKSIYTTFLQQIPTISTIFQQHPANDSNSLDIFPAFPSQSASQCVTSHRYRILQISHTAFAAFKLFCILLWQCLHTSTVVISDERAPHCLLKCAFQGFPGFGNVWDGLAGTGWVCTLWSNVV